METWGWESCAVVVTLSSLPLNPLKIRAPESCVLQEKTKQDRPRSLQTLYETSCNWGKKKCIFLSPQWENMKYLSKHQSGPWDIQLSAAPRQWSWFFFLPVLRFAGLSDTGRVQSTAEMRWAGSGCSQLPACPLPGSSSGSGMARQGHLSPLSSSKDIYSPTAAAAAAGTACPVLPNFGSIPGWMHKVQTHGGVALRI